MWQIKDADQTKFSSLAKKLHNPLAKNTSLSNTICIGLFWSEKSSTI
jgi:hypothetical protein